MSMDEGKSNAPIPCAANCGFFGNPATENMCSKCYKDLKKSRGELPSSKPSSRSASVDKRPSASPSPKPAPAPVSKPISIPARSNPVVESLQSPQLGATPSSMASSGASPRCPVCNKKVGLMAFDCRCGGSFCSNHRYPDTHECSYDWKQADQKKLEKENPVVQARKLERI